MGEKPRKEKICRRCKFFMQETEDMEAECMQDEDINSADFCEEFEQRGNNMREDLGVRDDYMAGDQ